MDPLRPRGSQAIGELFGKAGEFGLCGTFSDTEDISTKDNSDQSKNQNIARELRDLLETKSIFNAETKTSLSKLENVTALLRKKIVP